MMLLRRHFLSVSNQKKIMDCWHCALAEFGTLFRDLLWDLVWSAYTISGLSGKYRWRTFMWVLLYSILWNSTSSAVKNMSVTAADCPAYRSFNQRHRNKSSRTSDCSGSLVHQYTELQCYNWQSMISYCLTKVLHLSWPQTSHDNQAPAADTVHTMLYLDCIIDDAEHWMLIKHIKYTRQSACCFKIMGKNNIAFDQCNQYVISTCLLQWYFSH